MLRVERGLSSGGFQAEGEIDFVGALQTAAWSVRGSGRERGRKVCWAHWARESAPRGSGKVVRKATTVKEGGAPSATWSGCGSCGKCPIKRGEDRSAREAATSPQVKKRDFGRDGMEKAHAEADAALAVRRREANGKRSRFRGVAEGLQGEGSPRRTKGTASEGKGSRFSG